MNALLNQSGKPKPIGSTSILYNAKSNPAHLGEIVDVIDPRGQIINTAQVINVTQTEVTIKIVA